MKKKKVQPTMQWIRLTLTLIWRKKMTLARKLKLRTSSMTFMDGVEDITAKSV